MRYKIGIYSPNVAIYLAGVDRHFSDDECSGAIAHRDSVGRRRAGADQVYSAISLTVGDTYQGGIGQFVKPGRFAIGHYVIEKQFHKSGCNYRYGTEPGDR